jgi:ABC-2 type transport system permease protein
MHSVARIARREFAAFFSSITAFLFVGAFLFVCLFVFFWADPLFARNVADARPMFESMPLLLIFLVPALTMRMWSEERRAGTLELLMTSPISNLGLVLGKFLACLLLVSVTVALTVQIPITVMLLGDVDIGPVIGGYIATMFLAGAYIAIGLWVSARTDNQIVSLLCSIFVCSVFLVIGSDPVTTLFSNEMSELLRLIGSGSRFQSITRGVIDFRDLYYYLSIMGIFLTLNVLGLEKLRWAGNGSNPRHKQWLLVSMLLIANLIAGNFWLQQVGFARVDLTEGRIYTISDTTKRYLLDLKEPLLIRGYFSKKTHPLLAPLVPRLRDLLNEYGLAGRGKVKVEFVDPLDDPEMEREAGEKYGIKPVVFQVASKYQAAVVNSYFDVLVKYGDKFETLSFRDLIEVKAGGEQELDVELRNPEYDITSTIKKVISSYRSEGNLFADIKEPVTFTGYISADANLPEPLREFKDKVKAAVDKLKTESKGKFSVVFKEPEANGGVLSKKLETDYGFRPMALGMFEDKTFYFYMMLESGGQTIPVSLPQDLDSMSLEKGIKSALQRFSRGFLRTVGIWTERPDVQGLDVGDMKAKHFGAIREKLGSEFSVKNASFEGGKIASDIDVLLLLAPEKMDEKELFAIDQFLMRGGTVLVSTSKFDVDFEDALQGRKLDSGMNQWLAHHGVVLEDSMVLDPKNTPFPNTVDKKLGDYTSRQTMMVPYVYFVDVRPDGMDQTSGIMSGINQITVNWASPIKIDEAKTKGNTVIKMMSSSPESWTSPSTEIQPNITDTDKVGFPIGTDKGRKILAVAIEGQFQSYFKGKKPPVDAKKNPAAPAPIPGMPQPGASDETVNGVTEKSISTSRLVVFASNSFLSDEMLQLASAIQQRHYLNPIALVENSIDWSMGDRELLSIRGRGHFSRPLIPITPGEQALFEYVNYFIALVSLFCVWLWRVIFNRRAKKRYQKILAMRVSST